MPASPSADCARLLLDHRVRRLHHYAHTALWPSFQHYSLETNESLTAAFYRLSFVDDLLLNSFIWPAALAMSMVMPHMAVENNAVMLACQNRVVKCIREHIERNQVSDSVVFAVLTLTISDTNASRAMEESTVRRYGGFDPPFRSMGGNEMLSRFRFTPAHIDALDRLVVARGGLDKIRTPCVADQLQSTDILQASLSLSPPLFTLCQLYQHVLDNQIKPIRPPRERIEGVFPVHSPSFKDLLLDIRVYCRHLETLTDEAATKDSAAGSKPVSWETNVYRNLLQYQILQLPRYEEVEEELCRLASLIFMYGVIYPLAQRRPLDMLVKQLRRDLERHQNSSYPVSARSRGGRDADTPQNDTTSEIQKSPAVAPQSSREGMAEFLLWVGVLGALASKHSEHEPFFVDIVDTYAAAAGVTDFRQFKDVMRRFIWLDRACDVGALELWRTIRGQLESDIAELAAANSAASPRQTSEEGETQEMIDLICMETVRMPLS